MAETMQKWNGQDYLGKRFDDYFVLYTTNRDADTLTESNYRSIRKYLDDHPHVAYTIFTASHWACGWIEQILIYSGDAASVSFCNKIIEKLDDYPVFNDEDFSDLELEKAHEIQKEIRKEIDNLEPDEDLTGWEGITKDMTDEQIINEILSSGMIE